GGWGGVNRQVDPVVEVTETARQAAPGRDGVDVCPARASWRWERISTPLTPLTRAGSKEPWHPALRPGCDSSIPSRRGVDHPALAASALTQPLEVRPPGRLIHLAPGRLDGLCFSTGSGEAGDEAGEETAFLRVDFLARHGRSPHGAPGHDKRPPRLLHWKLA